jgi:glycerate kinase
MRIVIAPDSFKGTASAVEAATSIAEGWLEVRPHDDLTLIPMADGGEGTLGVLAAAVAGAQTRTVRGCTGPDGRPVDGRFVLLPDGTGAVELATTSGLPLLRRLNPLRAHTRGVGEVIAAALDAGAHRLAIAVGGSASTDGGTGALRALGLELYDSHDQPLADGGGALAALARIDRDGLRPPPAGGVEILSDVRNPLLGPNGAAARFGPQKGATPDDVAILDGGLARLAQLSDGDPAAPGTGAAGGTAFGFATFWQARITSGAAVIGDLVGLDRALRDADLVITGEGLLDDTSRDGKVVGHVAARARANGTPVVVICGSAVTTAWAPIVGVLALTSLAGTQADARGQVQHWLRAAGAQAARNADEYGAIRRPR